MGLIILYDAIYMKCQNRQVLGDKKQAGWGRGEQGVTASEYRVCLGMMKCSKIDG